MIGYEQALVVCRIDPETAARMLCEFARELDHLKAEVATLKAENAALRRHKWENGDMSAKVSTKRPWSAQRTITMRTNWR